MMGIYLRGKTYYIDYYIPNGRRIRERVGFSKALAQDVLRKRQVAAIENKHFDIKRDSKVKFDVFADRYLEVYSRQNNRSWKRSVLPNLKRLKAHFASKHLYEITPLEVEKYRREVSGEVQPATVNRILALLKSMFNRAIAWGDYHGTNPVKGIRFYREQPRLRFLAKEEIQGLVDSCPGHLRPIVMVALNTGMRKGEILGLMWHDVDIKREVVTLRDTKNGENREIPINTEVKEVLIQTKKHPESPYVFCSPDGKPYKDIRKSFYAACRKAGITDFRFHDLRHTYGSQLAMCGVDLKTISELMGHKSVRMTERYTHITPGHKRHAVERLGQIVTNRSQADIEEDIDRAQLIMDNKVAYNGYL
ncbi:tyrosine-type recombinase/integrase [Candidatus Omnitrophota bacterium]